MLQGNRRLAAVIATLLAVVGTAALTIIGVSTEVALAAIGVEATVGGLQSLRGE